MAFKSRSTFLAHCKNTHGFEEEEGDEDQPLPPHKVALHADSRALAHVAETSCRDTCKFICFVAVDIQVSDVRHGLP